MVVGDILKVVLEILMSYIHSYFNIVNLNYKIQYYRYIVKRIVDSESVSHTNAQAMVLSHHNRFQKKWTMVCAADALLAKDTSYLCSSFVNLRS